MRESPQGCDALFSSNRLLCLLPRRVLTVLRPYLERCNLRRGDTLNTLNEPITDLYFVEQGVVSLVKTLRDGHAVEIAAIGAEGMTGLGAVLGGVECALVDAVVQITGVAVRVKRAVFEQQLQLHPEIFKLMQVYAGLVVAQITQTAACNCVHALEERFCRWLLIAHDGAGADHFMLTHEFLSMMLGVRRPSVSLIARKFQEQAAITYTHGAVTILDRQRLERACCECYAGIRTYVEQFLGPRQALCSRPNRHNDPPRLSSHHGAYPGR